MSNIEHRITKEEMHPRHRGDDLGAPGPRVVGTSLRSASCAQQRTVDSGRRIEIATACEAGLAMTEGPRRAGTSLRSACEDCEQSVAAGCSSDLTLICKHKADCDLPWQVVEPEGTCANFERSRQLVPVDITAALAEGAKLIPLSQDKFAIVDSEDYDRLNKYKWCLTRSPRTNYAVRGTKGKRVKGKRAKRKTILMHRVILNAPPGLVVDHINHNGLDNRKSNLRLCTRKQNNRNKQPQGKTSRYKGVYFSKRHKKFIARITVNGKQIHIGVFTDQIAAAKAYDRKAKELFGEFAFLNFPDPRQGAF